MDLLEILKRDDLASFKAIASKDDLDLSGLERAIECRAINIVSHILDGNIIPTSVLSHTAVSLAREEDAEMLRVLRDSTSFSECDTLLIAVFNKETDVVKCLLENGFTCDDITEAIRGFDIVMIKLFEKYNILYDIKLMLTRVLAQISKLESIGETNTQNYKDTVTYGKYIHDIRRYNCMAGKLCRFCNLDI